MASAASSSGTIGSSGSSSRRPSSFLALIQGTSSRKRPRQKGGGEEELPPVHHPSSPVPGFEWVHVRETRGRLHLYRHAPRTHHHPHRIGQAGGEGGGGGGGGIGGGAPRWRSRSQVGISLGGLSESNSRGEGGDLCLQGEGEEDDTFYYTLFRPARLSTVLLLGCCTSDSEGTTGCLSARQILEGLSLITPRIAFLHIIRETHRHGSSTHVLVTLDSIEATEGWVDMLEGRELSLGGQLVYISGVVMVDEVESDALLSCLKSLVDDIGAGGGGGGKRGAAGSPEELAQLGTIQVQGNNGRGREEGDNAYCLAFGPPADALALLSSLVLLEEKEEKEESKQSTTQEDGHDAAKEGEEEGELLSLLSQGLDSYLAELPTCLQCLDRLDPVAVGTALGPPSLPGAAASYFPQRMITGAVAGGLGNESRAAFDGASPSTSPPLPPLVCPTCHKVQIYAHSQKRNKRSRGSAAAASASPSLSSSSSLPLTCNTCSIPENLWICLVCGHVGCGRYTAEHAKQHFHQSGHIFSLELATGRVWDYLEDAFVHSMQSQGGGAVHVDEEGGEGGEGEGGGGGGGGGDKGRQGKLDGLGAEYSALLMSQLEEQNMYYERLLAKTAAELVQSSCQDDQLSEQERKEAAQARAQITKLEEEYTRLMVALREAEEKGRQMRGRNQGLLSEQKRETERLKSLCASIQEAKTSLVEEVADLEAQISDLSFFLRTKEAVQENSELEGGGVVIKQSPSAPTQDERGGRRRRGSGGGGRNSSK